MKVTEIDAVEWVGQPERAVDGLVIVDKPGGWTSHDVVARMRRLANTRKVGHAGTLDPMATGVLVIGIGKATKLLGRITATEKTYEATIRLGISTNTDDAQGEVIASASVGDLASNHLVIIEEIAKLTGEIRQRPSSVSAIKVDGQRAYKRVRAGEEVILAPRPVVVSEFKLLSVTSVSCGYGDVVDLEVVTTVSSGTYVRALARDLGEQLGTGGHLLALRRTRVGPFAIAEASTLEELAVDLRVIPLAQVCREMFQLVEVAGQELMTVSHGGRLSWPEELDRQQPVAIFGPDGEVLALAEFKDNTLAPSVVWAALTYPGSTHPTA